MRQRELVWRNLLLVIRRAPRDKGARRVIWGVAFLVFYIAGELLLLRQEFREGGWWSFEISVVIGVFALLTAWFIRRRNARADDGLLKLSERAITPEDDLKGHRKAIVAALLGTAALCDRAAVESLAQDGKVTEAQRGIGRQRALAVAQLEIVWATLSVRERNLLIADEGSWAWDEVWPWLVRSEDVRVMRWVIGMDEVLRPFEFLKPDLSPVFRTTTHAEEVNGDRCLAAYDLRPAETIAHATVARCVAEGVKRGYWAEEDEAAKTAYLELADRMRLDESEDLLIGTRSVAKADEKDIRWVAQAALRRLKTLESLIKYLNGPSNDELRIKEIHIRPSCPGHPGPHS